MIFEQRASTFEGIRMSTIAIGDVHGKLAALDELLNRITGRSARWTSSSSQLERLKHRKRCRNGDAPRFLPHPLNSLPMAISAGLHKVREM